MIRRLEEALALVYRTLRSPTELEATPLIAGLLQARAPCTRSWQWTSAVRALLICPGFISVRPWICSALESMQRRLFCCSISLTC